MLARNDPRVRLLEGLEQRVEVLHGDVPEQIAVREGPVEYEVDPWKGQKTGLFLDQRENREAAARYARGRLLDASATTAALRCAWRAMPTGRKPSTSRPMPWRGSPRMRGATALANLEAREANVFDELRGAREAGERYDTIVLDPPAFAKNKASIQRRWPATRTSTCAR